MKELLKYANSSSPRTEDEKLAMIEHAAEHYGKYMTALGIDWENQGCYADAPRITAFDNLDGYDGVVFQGNIDVKSFCSHHHLPFVGYAHVAYIPSSDGKVIGLSKLNRIVEYFARRPQVQENLTMQIHDYINEVCEGNKGVSVMIAANHMCACVRGVRHDSTMMTSKMSGAFLEDPAARNEFYRFVDTLKK